MSLKLSVAPAAEPISTADAKTHLRVASDFTGDDTYIDTLVKAARIHAEEITWRQLITATWVLKLDEFPTGDKPIHLPRPPLASVTSITYVDTAGVTQTLSSSLYTVDTDSEPGVITPIYGQIWPFTRCVRNAVTITYVAGYGASGASVSADILHAIKLLVGHWYENREEVIVGTITSQLPAAANALLQMQAVRDERILEGLA